MVDLAKKAKADALYNEYKKLERLAKAELDRIKYQIGLGFNITRLHPELQDSFYAFMQYPLPKMIVPQMDPQYKGQVH